MEQKDKELLLQDLCARLPYGFTIYRLSDNANLKINDIDDFAHFLEYSDGEEFKPYLRPMSSMTEEEHRELSRLINDDKLLTGDPAKTVCLHCGVVIDFHNSHHLDWRGLIPKGLALEATEGMYK